MIYLFYEEPDPYRWIPGDQYVRKIIRRVVRGAPTIGGMRRYFVNLCRGLDKLNVPYEINNYGTLRKDKNIIACVVGKHHVLDKLKSPNRILYGPAVISHPIDDLQLMTRLPVAKIVVSCEWLKQMYEMTFNNVGLWAAGVDTEYWEPEKTTDEKEIDILIYDKIRWNYKKYEQELIKPIKDLLKTKNIRFETIKYGNYKEVEYRALLKESKSMLFLCEHETEGFAYLQALSSGVPIIAWDRGGYWRDPHYFPDRVKYSPVTSVPYWDKRCGITFKTVNEFAQKIEAFKNMIMKNEYAPRNYILENLTLEKCARQYSDIVEAMG